MKPCARCGTKLETWMQFGRDVLHPLCWRCWQAEGGDSGQLPLPEAAPKRQPQLWETRKDDAPEAAA